MKKLRRIPSDELCPSQPHLRQISVVFMTENEEGNGDMQGENRFRGTEIIEAKLVEGAFCADFELDFCSFPADS